MRVDASLVSLLLAASASAQHSYNATTGYNSTANGHLISELEKEVQELRAKLEAATEAASTTCQAHGSGPAYGQSGAPGSGAQSGAAGAASASVGSAGSGAAPSGYNGQTGASSPASSAAAAQGAQGAQGASSSGNSPGYYIHTGYGYSSEAPSAGSPAQTQPAGYASQNNGGSGASESTANGASAQPAGYSAAPAAGSSQGASAQQPAGYSAVPQGSSGAVASSSNAAPVASATSTPDYYAPLPPSETSTNTITSTKTVIVTAGTITVSESIPTSAQSGESGVYTVTETYHGSAPIPSPPSSSAESASAAASASASSSAVISSLRSSISAGISSVSSSIAAGVSATAPYGSAPYGYGNGTSTGFLTGSAKVPTSSGTGAAVPTFACNPAHSYPGGASCISTAGSLTLVTPSASATSASQTFTAGNSTSSGLVGTGSAVTSTGSAIVGTGSSAIISAKPTVSVNSTSSSTSSSASATATAIDCSAICSTNTKFNDWDVTPMTCTQLKAGTSVNTPSGQSSVGCATSFTPELDLCQVTLNVKTSGTANTYMEVWLPNGNSTSWNGRSMNTDNGGLNGCVHYVDMQYVSGLGFAAIGDNAGHNGSSFDGTWTMDNNEAIVDWAYRARHAAVDVGKQVIDTFYSKKPEYSYYIGCSAGGAQGLQSAQKFPNDFDGIIAGASANDFNHLQDWSAHFRQLTGATTNDTFLTEDDWTTVQSYILSQCDAKLDGVDDGILEDPTICDFDVSAIPVCNDTTTTGCLDATQIETVKEVFKPLYNAQGALIYPPLLYGAQVDAFRLGLLSGTIQGIAEDWFQGGVYNNSNFNILNLNQQDYAVADSEDDLHGNPSAFNGDLSGLQGAGSKLIMYHGMADPMTSGYNSQRYYQKVAKTMGASNADLDEFFRFFRISGMAHCGVGGISGAGAWMFGQSGQAAAASNNIVEDLVSWVEKGDAPDVMLGTKFWYDTPSLGIEFERPHCRYPYRTTYIGGGADSTLPSSWTCKFIDDWQECEDVTCSADGTFT